MLSMHAPCLSLLCCRSWHFNTVCSGGATLYCQPVSQSMTLAESCCYLLTSACYHLFQAQPEFMTAKRGERPMGFLSLTSATGAATVSQPQCRDASWWPGLALKWKGMSRENREKNNLIKNRLHHKTTHAKIGLLERTQCSLSPLTATHRSDLIFWLVFSSVVMARSFVFTSVHLVYYVKRASLQFSSCIDFITVVGRVCIYSWLVLTKWLERASLSNKDIDFFSALFWTPFSFCFSWNSKLKRHWMPKTWGLPLTT